MSSIIHIDESTVKWRESVQAEWGKEAEEMRDRIAPLQVCGFCKIICLPANELFQAKNRWLV